MHYVDPVLTPELSVAVIGGGPAGLMAAQTLVDAGESVHLFDAMPSAGRKFLLAGKGGLNLTHSEGADAFAGRFGVRRAEIGQLLKDFGPGELRNWSHALGIPTFVGSSGRVFPADMKAAPLLRAWLLRMRHPPAGQGVQFHMRHRWTGWGDGPSHTLRFDTPGGALQVNASTVVLALGGGSWARLGSNGAWVPLLVQRGVAVAPLLPANCGFDVENGWSAHFCGRYAGAPLKSVAITLKTTQGVVFSRKGEFVVTATGVEGSLVYAAASWLRDDVIRSGRATFTLDLLPDLNAQRVLMEVGHPRGSRSLSSHLKSRLHLDGVKMGLLYELLDKEALADPVCLAAAIKALPVTLTAARPIDEAISTAGGVLFEVLTPGLMLEQLPGVFCAGEMLDWEAPTGGYLLTACFASGRRAGLAVREYLQKKRQEAPVSKA